MKLPSNDHLDLHPCGPACWYASTHVDECTCDCDGIRHGASARSNNFSTPASRARTWTRLPQVPDDEPF